MSTASAPVTTPAGGWKRSLLLSSPGIGLATVAVTLPLILLVPARLAWVVAFAALCIYPVLDAPRNAARRSWWLGAVLSTVVWFVVMSVLAGVADARAHLRESAMVFLLPAMMFPPVLLISGLVRLHRRMRGLPREPGVRVAALLGGSVCALMIGVPTALNFIPAMIANSTGNTPRNTILSGSRTEVDRADAGQVTVKGAGSSGPLTFQITPETRFGFLGSGKHPDDSKAGLDWLKPGQPVSVDYVFREHVAHARRITIWVDRKGCAGDERWMGLAPPPADAALAGTTWEGRLGADDITTFELLPAGRLTFRGPNSAYRDPNGAWRQDGRSVLIQVNDCYAQYAATLDGERMSGEFANEMGFRQPWSAVRLAPARAGSPPP